MSEFDLLVDATGLSCPMPLLKAKQGLNSLQAGQVLKVMATDSGSVRDFQSFINLTSHTLMDKTDSDGVYSYWIQKG